MSGMSPIRKAFLALVGLGSAAGVTGGYWHLGNQMSGIRGTNIELSQKIDATEAANTTLAGELEKAQATITALQTGMSTNNVQITQLGEKSIRHDQQIATVSDNLQTVKVKVNGLENEVSLSDVKAAIDEGLKSTVALRYGFSYVLKDKQGNIRDRGNEEHSGSGFVVAHINGGKNGGLIATNWHVVSSEILEDLSKVDPYKNGLIVSVYLPGGKRLLARPFYYIDRDGKEKLARSEDHDLAILQVTGDISETIPVKFASDEPKMGEAVVVLGAPFLPDYGNNCFSGTFGVISGKNVAIFNDPDHGVVLNIPNENGGIPVTKTDAVINPGSSGGFIKRISDGGMVGMPTFINQSQQYNGESFGTTASTISSDIQQWLSPSHKLNSEGQFIQVAPLEPVEDKPAVAKKPASIEADSAPAIAKKP